MKNEIKFIGNLKLRKNVVVTDPCYDLDTWCIQKVDNVAPGEYKAYVDYVDTGNMGIRVSRLYVVKGDDDLLTIMSLERGWQFLGTIGVDSGQAGIFDIKYYQDSADKALDFDRKYNSQPIAPTDKFYDAMCDLTLRDEQAGTYEHGAISSSGYGDGGYELLAKQNDKWQYIAFCIDFGLTEYEE